MSLKKTKKELIDLLDKGLKIALDDITNVSEELKETGFTVVFKTTKQQLYDNIVQTITSMEKSLST